MVFLRGKILRNNGSITVEASIVIPIIILSIAAAIYIGMVLYQRALLQSMADRAAEAGAAAWKNSGRDTGTGKSEISELDSEGLYWRIFDADKNEKLQKIEQYIQAISNKSNILHPSGSNIKAEVKDYIVYKRLEITVENTYKIPIGGLLRIFGASDYFTVRVKSLSVIDDPSELIRNTDFVIDIEKELENKYPGLKNLTEKTREVLGDMKGKIDGFMD